MRTWTLRLLVPRRFRKAVSLYKAAVREELWSPMNPSVTQLTEPHFRSASPRAHTSATRPTRSIRREFKKQGGAKIQSLYRAWRRQGDRVIWDARTRRRWRTTTRAVVRPSKWSS
ncbi:MAG: hypothetical protein U0P30_09580 [Vicinamibacterales bacterium]